MKFSLMCHFWWILECKRCTAVKLVETTMYIIVAEGKERNKETNKVKGYKNETTPEGHRQ